MGKMQMSNSERQARFRNTQEQQQLRKQLEELSLKEMSNKHLGRVETQKWRQFMKDCVKNTGSCSLVMEKRHKCNHDNIPTTERRHVMSRQRSQSETQIHINRRNKFVCSFSNEPNPSVCSEFTDGEEISQRAVQSGRSPRLSMSHNGTTTGEAIKHLYCSRIPRLEGSVGAWVQPAPPFAASRSFLTRTSAASSPVTELVEDAELALSNPAFNSHFSASRLTSYLADTPGSTRFVSTGKPRQVHVVADFTSRSGPQHARYDEGRLGLSNDTNNLQTMTSQIGWYPNDMKRNAQQEHKCYLHTYKLPGDVKKTVTSTDNIIPRLSVPLTGKSEPVEECRKSPSIAETYNSHEQRPREKLQQTENKTGEIIYYNTITQSNSRVVCLCLSEPGYLEMDSITRPTVEQEGYRSKEPIVSDDQPELIDTNHASSSAEDGYERKIQFLREITRKNQTLFSSTSTDSRNAKSSTSSRRHRIPVTSLGVPGFVTNPPHVRNEPDREVKCSVCDQTTNHIQQKQSDETATEIDLHQFAEQFQVTLPAKDRSGGCDSKSLILTKAPLLSQGLHNPDRIINSPLYEPGNRLTCDQNSRLSYDGQKLGKRHFKGCSCSDYQTGQHSSHSARPELRHVSIKLRNQNLNIKGNDKILFRNDDRCADKNLLVNCASRRQIISTILSKNVREKYATDTAADRLSRSSVGLSNSSTDVIKRQVGHLKDSDNRQVGHLKDSDSYRHDQLTKQMTERLELGRPVNNRQKLTAVSVQKSPIPTRQNVKNPEVCFIIDQCDDTTCCITDQCKDTSCCIIDQCDDTPYCITDQCDDTPASTAGDLDGAHYNQNSGERLSRVKQGKQPPKSWSDIDQSSFFRVDDIRKSRQPSCILDRELSKQSPRNKPSCVLDRELSKQSPRNKPPCVLDRELLKQSPRTKPSCVLDRELSKQSPRNKPPCVLDRELSKRSPRTKPSCVLDRELSKQSPTNKPSCVLDRELSKQSPRNKPPCVLDRELSKQLCGGEQPRESTNLILGSKDLKKPEGNLSGNNFLTLDSKHSNKSAHMFCDVNICRESTHGKSNVEMSRQPAYLVERETSQASFCTPQARDSANCLTDLSECKESAIVLSDMNHFKECSNTKTPRQLNAVASHDIKNEANRFKRYAQNVVFCHGEYDDNLDESSHVNNNYVDFNNGVHDKGVLTSHAVCNTNHNMLQGTAIERVSLYQAENNTFFEASPSVSNIRDIKMASVAKASCNITGQGKPGDSSLLSREKDITTGKCQETRTRLSDCRTDQHHKLLDRSWQTAGGRVIAGSQLHKWTATADVMMSKRVRQRAITKMVEDNLRRPINSQQILANESLRMRVEDFLRSL